MLLVPFSIKHTILYIQKLKVCINKSLLKLCVWLHSVMGWYCSGRRVAGGGAGGAGRAGAQGGSPRRAAPGPAARLHRFT